MDFSPTSNAGGHAPADALVEALKRTLDNLRREQVEHDDAAEAYTVRCIAFVTEHLRSSGQAALANTYLDALGDLSRAIEAAPRRRMDSLDGRARTADPVEEAFEKAERASAAIAAAIDRPGVVGTSGGGTGQ